MSETLNLNNRNLNLKDSILYSLTKFRGINFSLSKFILHKVQIPASLKVQDLSEQQLQILTRTLNQDRINLNVPEYLITDKISSTCAIQTNLRIIKQRNINWQKAIKTYRGVRHILNQKVHGQRTKSTGRSNKKIKGFRPKKIK